MRDAKKSLAVVLPGFHGGGAERVVLSIACSMAAAGHPVTIVVLSGEGPLRSLVPDTVPVLDIGEPRLRKAVVKLGSALSGIAPDTVLSTMGYLNVGVVLTSLLWPRLWKTRIILREANMPFVTAAAVGSEFLTRSAYRLLYRRAALVLCNSKRMRDELIAYGVSRRQLRLIENPVDVASIRNAAQPIRRREGPGPRFVAIGRMVPQKGYDRLFDWMKAGPVSASVTILGDGPERSRLEAMIACSALADQVFMPGFKRESAAYLAGADALLLPSRWEGMPNVALEALALGIPVIASAEAGGIDELAAECPGLVTVAHDGPSFTAAMRHVAIRTDLAVPPCQLPARFRLDRVVARYKTILFSEAEEQ